MKLTLKRIKAKALEAYRARRLTAQHRDQDKRERVYQVDNYHCAIGAALTKTTLEEIKGRGVEGVRVGSLRSRGIISFNEKDFSELVNIQSLHDEWARNSCNHGASSSVAQNARRKFLEVIAA
jgi:hypothetical protein